MDAILGALGAGTNDVLAAFLGSICGAFMLTKPSAIQVLSTVFVGTCVGTYAGPQAMRILGQQPNNLLTLIIGSIGTFVLMWAGSKVKRQLGMNGDVK